MWDPFFLLGFTLTFFCRKLLWTFFRSESLLMN
jgi:hypothetical protein